MRNKIVFILVVLFIAFAYFFYSNTAVSDYIKKAITTKNKGTNPLDLIPVTKNQKTAAKTVVDSSTPVETKSATQVYDSDPVVDASLILEKHFICYRLLSKQSRQNNHFFKQFELQLGEKQIKFHRNYINNCEKLNQDSPNLKLGDLKSMRKQLASAEPTSLWGKIIQGDISVESLSDFEVLDLLKQNNLNILTQAPKKLSHYYNKVIHWDLEDVLANHQYDYVKQILAYSHQVYLCSLGADCEPNSSVMAMLCYINSRGCGINYNQYVSQVLTLGQQADIQLALAYLQQKYQ